MILQASNFKRDFKGWKQLSEDGVASHLKPTGFPYTWVWANRLLSLPVLMSPMAAFPAPIKTNTEATAVVNRAPLSFYGDSSGEQWSFAHQSKIERGGSSYDLRIPGRLKRGGEMRGSEVLVHKTNCVKLTMFPNLCIILINITTGYLYSSLGSAGGSFMEGLLARSVCRAWDSGTQRHGWSVFTLSLYIFFKKKR